MFLEPTVHIFSKIVSASSTDKFCLYSFLFQDVQELTKLDLREKNSGI